MSDQEQDHISAGWNEDHTLRWIEVGRLRLEEDDKGSTVKVFTDRRHSLDHVRSSWLSDTELAGLTRELAGWFADDPADTLRQIETCATYVKAELEAWNERARIDEEHPPYDELTHALDAQLKKCRHLREVLGRFTGKQKPVITIEEEAL
jgi:hypothetical protein